LNENVDKMSGIRLVFVPSKEIFNGQVRRCIPAIPAVQEAEVG
jgi:hypothetical protein